MSERVARVQPDVPAVARAFDYLVPADIADAVAVGTIVRVPLHGRRVRGWVLADDVEPEPAADRLVSLAAVVSAGPPRELVALSRWAAWRWAGLVTGFLRAASPPNVVPPRTRLDVAAALYPVASPPATAGVPAWAAAAVRVITWPPAADRRRLVTSLLAPEGSTLILVPEPTRAKPLVRALAQDGREVLHHHSALDGRTRTHVWDAARRGALVVVGGRAAVWLPLPDLRAVVVLDESDEAFQDERAPTWHARDLVLERARRVGAVVTLVSPAPTVDARHAASAAVAAPARELRAGWPVLDVVDLRAEPPGATLLSEALGPAIHRALTANGRAIAVVNRRGRARVLACRACQTLARCTTCGAAVAQRDDDLVCPRCGATRPTVCAQCNATRFRAVRPGIRAVRDDLDALLPRVDVGDVDASTGALPDAPVLVGTEAVLHRIRRERDRPVRLVAFLAFDEELLASRYRAHEQALWLLVRAARLLGARSDGSRLLVQTRMPEHDVLGVAASGDPERFGAAEATMRAAVGFPPFGALAEVSGAVPAVAAAVTAIRAVGLDVLAGTDTRALVRAATIDALADGLAAADLVGARAAGRLRVSVDPPRV